MVGSMSNRFSINFDSVLWFYTETGFGYLRLSFSKYRNIKNLYKLVNK